MNCARGFDPSICLGGGCDAAKNTDGRNASSDESKSEVGADNSTDENDSNDTEDESADSEEDSSRRVAVRASRRNKRDDSLKDQQSTGRKRAARLYPLHSDQPCEWRGRERMGGGSNPIRGCDNGLQQARHHGPDKNTLNNEEGNVHRICHGCHNRWHAANDPDYDPNKQLKD